MLSPRRGLALLGLLLLHACDEAPPEADAGPADAGTTPIVCDVPAPLVAGTAETDALADAPARCGQSDHAWLRSDELGTPTALAEPDRFSRTVLNATAEGLGYVLPRSAERNVELRVVTYVTQDRGSLVEATALLAYPERSEPGEELPVLVFLHGTTGFSDGCNASADPAYRLLSAMFASWGYLVVTPDFIGLRATGETGFLHPYLAGQPTAIASLDAVRAAIRVDAEERGGACGARRFVTYGASQGGHATLWVDRIAPYYARELEHAGAVAAVPPADLVGQFTHAMSGVEPSTSNTAAFFAATSGWYGLADRLPEVFVSPWDVDVLARVRTDCSPNVVEPTSVDEVFTTAILDAVADDLGAYGDFGCMARESGLETSIPRLAGDAPSYGILFATAEDDVQVYTPIERGSFTALCDAGLPIDYLECAAAPHVDGAIWALPETFAFLEARLAGEPFERPTSCAPTAPRRCLGTPDGS